MPFIKQESIERIKELPIYDVVSKYIDLKKSGVNWSAKSPFTDEKTASFYVVPKKNIFKCHSSGIGGGPIKFVQKFHGDRLPFVDVVKEIADKCNEHLEYEEVANPEEYKKEVDHKELLYKVNQAAANKYCELLINLGEKVDGLKYPAIDEVIGKRKYTKETVIQWEIGYAPGDSKSYEPQSWKFLTDLIGAKSYAEAIELGLIKEDNGHTYDIFRHRIMYPIHNHLGRIVGFGGRTLAVADGSDFKPAKYLNSADSALYHKETVLFGLYFAIAAIREAGLAYLAEGYTDVISFHQAGHANTVATCGTALTREQCKMLKRYTTKVALLRDNDTAGEKATLRDIDLLLEHGFDVSVVPMPKFDDGRKVDPDDLTRMFKPIAL